MENWLRSEPIRKTLEIAARTMSGRPRMTIVWGQNNQTDCVNYIELCPESCIHPDQPQWVEYALLQALRDHEVGHQFTHPKAKEAAQLMAPTSGMQKLYGDIFNILEDARIELLMANKFPGCRPYLVFLNEFLFKRMESLDSMEEKGATRLELFMYALAQQTIVGRVKGTIKDKVVRDRLESIEALIRESRFAPDSAPVISCTVKIGENILDLFQEFGSTRKELPKFSKSMDPVFDKNHRPTTAPPIVSDIHQVPSDAGQEAMGLSEVAIQLEEEFHSYCRSREQQPSLDDDSSQTHSDNDEDADETAFCKASRQVKPLVDNIASELKALKEREKPRRKRGQVHGTLSTLDLHRLTLGDPKVFQIHRPLAAQKDIAVGLLIDESGSMQYENRYRSAMAGGILFHLALKSVKIPHFVWGFTASEQEPIHLKYIDFATCDSDDAVKELGRIRPKNGNMDGISILAGAEFLAQRQEKMRILLVISDGLPAYGNNPIQETREAVWDCHKRFIPVVGISIGESHNHVPEIYQHYILVDDVHSLPLHLGSVLRQIVLAPKMVPVTFRS